jgi:glycosidase
MLAEGEKPGLHIAGFDETYTWDNMRAMADLYSGRKNLAQYDSALNASFRRFPQNAYRMYFTTNHDENSWNGTEFEKYGNAYRAFAVLTQTMYQSVPLIYSGQELPNKKRLKFFVKDTIGWNGSFELASFYSFLLKLRKSNPALAAGAFYKRLATTDDAYVFAYERKKGARKVLVILNLSGRPRSFRISEKGVTGVARNVFTGKKEKISAELSFNMGSWGYGVYDY